MKLLFKQITLPILIGISLSGISVGVLYFLLKKDENDSKNSIRTKSKKRDQVLLEVPILRQFIPMIIGRGGQTIKNIESNTSTKINFAEDNVEKPTRVCYIRGEQEGVKLAEAMIKNLINNQPLVTNYDLYVPTKFYSIMQADRCQMANDIQAITRAKIILDKNSSPNDDDQRRLIIVGTKEQIKKATDLIEDKIDEFNLAKRKLEAGQLSRPVRGKNSRRNSAVSQTEAQVHSEDKLDIHEGTMEVYVSAVTTPNQFWIQVVGTGTLALDALVKEMTSYYENQENQEMHNLKDITQGQIVATKYTFDNKWYRGEIMDIKDDDKYEVFFLDYGDHQIVKRDSIMELRTDFLSLTFQAVECCVANINPISKTWSNDAITAFMDLTWCADWKVLIAKVRRYKERTSGVGCSRREGSPIPCVDLYDKNDGQDINVGKQMVDDGYAVVESEGLWSTSSSTISLSRRSHEGSLSPTPIKSDSNKNTTMLDNETPEKLKKSKVIEHVDLVTPKKSYDNSVIEEIDLVTPVKYSSQQLIEAEKEQNIKDNKIYNKDSDKIEYSTNGNSQWKPTSNAIPGGMEFEEESVESEMEIF